MAWSGQVGCWRAGRPSHESGDQSVVAWARSIAGTAIGTSLRMGALGSDAGFPCARCLGVCWAVLGGVDGLRGAVAYRVHGPLHQSASRLSGHTEFLAHLAVTALPAVQEAKPLFDGIAGPLVENI